MAAGQLDELDHQLLALLRDDARLSMAELGRRVGLSRTAALARVQRLEERGAIRGYHADVVPGAADGGHVARVGIVVRTPDPAAYVRRLAALEEVEEVESIAGELDLMVRLCAPTAEALDAALDRINGWRETLRTTTYVVLTRYVG